MEIINIKIWNRWVEGWYRGVKEDLRASQERREREGHPKYRKELKTSQKGAKRG